MRQHLNNVSGGILTNSLHNKQNLRRYLTNFSDDILTTSLQQTLSSPVPYQFLWRYLNNVSTTNKIFAGTLPISMTISQQRLYNKHNLRRYLTNFHDDILSNSLQQTRFAAVPYQLSLTISFQTLQQTQFAAVPYQLSLAISYQTLYNKHDLRQYLTNFPWRYLIKLFNKHNLRRYLWRYLTWLPDELNALSSSSVEDSLKL